MGRPNVAPDQVGAERMLSTGDGDGGDCEGNDNERQGAKRDKDNCTTAGHGGDSVAAKDRMRPCDCGCLTSCSCSSRRPKGISVEHDYRVPGWVRRQGARFDYEYNSTMIGKHGVINYCLQGDVSDSLIVTFHGLNGTQRTFEECSHYLSKYGFRVLTFDLYGHGLSEAPRFNECGSSYGLSFFIQQTEELLGYLGMDQEPISVMGFSMGCVIAVGYAEKHRDEVERVCLISPAGLLPKKPCPVRCLKTCPCCVNIFPCCITRCCCCLHKKRFMKKFGEDEIENGVAEALWERYMWLLFVKKGVMAALMGCVSRLPLWSAKPLFERMGASGAPVLLLWGEEDQVVPVECAKSVQECFPNSHLIVFPRATHLLLADPESKVPAIATILTFAEFNHGADMPKWSYTLPYSSKGEYVPRGHRAPAGLGPEEYHLSINYVPRFTAQVAGKGRRGRVPRPRRTAPPPDVTTTAVVTGAGVDGETGVVTGAGVDGETGVVTGTDGAPVQGQGQAVSADAQPASVSVFTPIVPTPSAMRIVRHQYETGGIRVDDPFTPESKYTSTPTPSGPVDPMSAHQPLAVGVAATEIPMPISYEIPMLFRRADESAMRVEPSVMIMTPTTSRQQSEKLTTAAEVSAMVEIGVLKSINEEGQWTDDTEIEAKSAGLGLGPNPIVAFPHHSPSGSLWSMDVDTDVISSQPSFTTRSHKYVGHTKSDGQVSEVMKRVK